MATGPQGQRSLRQLGLGRGSRIVINISGGEASLGNEVSRLIDEQDEMMAAEDEARLAAEDRGLQAAVDREWQKSFPDMTAEPPCCRMARDGIQTPSCSIPTFPSKLCDFARHPRLKADASGCVRGR